MNSYKRAPHLFSDGLNISSSQPQPQPLDNLTLQTFVKDYVDEYVGRFTVASPVTVPFLGGGDDIIKFMFLGDYIPENVGATNFSNFRQTEYFLVTTTATATG